MTEDEMVGWHHQLDGHCISLIMSEVEHLFQVFISHLYVFGEMSVSVFCPLVDLVVFLALSCMRCLCILVINSLSVVSFAVIFSHSEGCLFTLFIVSFAVLKLLSLVWSHLFIFVFTSITLKRGS